MDRKTQYQGEIFQKISNFFLFFVCMYVWKNIFNDSLFGRVRKSMDNHWNFLRGKTPHCPSGHRGQRPEMFQDAGLLLLKLVARDWRILILLYLWTILSEDLFFPTWAVLLLWLIYVQTPSSLYNVTVFHLLCSNPSSSPLFFWWFHLNLS